MSQQDSLNLRLTRRSWLVLATSTLTACGGGGSGGSTAGTPGTGGTGIYAQGSISGFGSVIVNGIKFDDLKASVQVDGVTATSADLRLGMVVSVEGVRSTDTALGTASSIEAWTIAQGLVTAGAAGQFTLSGMTVQTDSATVFDVLGATTTPLSAGLRVAVWGLQAAADGSRWTATRVAVVPATTVVGSGMVSLQGSQRYLNGLLLTGAAAGNLSAGQLVRVQGELAAGGINVQSVKLQGSGGGLLLQGEAEIEGLVTAVLSARRFKLGGFEVDTSGASFSPSTVQIKTGVRVEVEGSWQVGVLMATKVKMEDAQSLSEVEIEAPIEQFNSLANFVVRGQRCDATGVTISHGTVADLKVGVKVHVKGTIAGDVLRVTELELDI